MLFYVSMLHCKLIIERLSFLVAPGNKQISVFKITYSKVIILSSAFRGSDKNSARSIHITQSAIKIVNCLFERNSADDGGAIYALASRITLISNAFIANRAVSRGGAIFSDGSTILIDKGNVFSDNNFCSV